VINSFFDGVDMTNKTGNPARALSHSARWALEQAADKRYGSGTPTLSWSVTQELTDAGFIATSGRTRSTVSITQAGLAFLRGLAG
jgi:hypothetical protein